MMRTLGNDPCMMGILELTVMLGNNMEIGDVMIGMLGNDFK